MRIHQIDALRGFALLGILIVNIFIFHAPYPYYTEFYGQFEGIDGLVVENTVFFFGGKFMFIYAFLFGYSFWIQFEKCENEADFRRYWNKRMSLLAGFGILHILLLSFGDILLPYAILGLTLPFFVKLNNSKLLIWLVLINLIPLYEFVLRGFLDFPSIFMQPAETLERYIEINGEGDFMEMLKLRVSDYFSIRNEKLILYLPKELSLFLLGIICARKEMATKLNNKKAILFSVVAILVIGIMYFFRTNIIALFDYEKLLLHRTLLGLIIHLSEFVHGLLYIVGFFMLWKIPIIQKLLFYLSYPGRLSLTNYLSQSLICIVIFSGLGYYAQFTPYELILTAIAIYTTQLLFSKLWLKYYQFGPLEYVWRKYAK